MNTPHQDLQKAKEELIDLLKHHEAVLAFQEAEKAIGQVPQISHLAGQMKAYQQEAVLFQKIEKQRAYEEAGEQADLIQHELENLPIVQDYRQKMQDASDLIQYVTKSIELVWPIWMCQRVNFLRQSWTISVQFVVKFRTLRHVK